MSTTEEFTKVLRAIDFDQLSLSTVSAVECALIDHCGVGLMGSQQPWSRIIAEHALSSPYEGPVPLYGREEQVTAGLAARLNGASAHGFELDDIYEPGSLHPGAPIIPAVLSTAIVNDAPGQEVLAAIVAGYEAMGRIALATASHLTPFHTTGTHGTLGAAIAVAHLTGLDESEFSNVLGIAASMSAGLKAFQTGGGEVKRLHAGRSAEAGVAAVELAQLGLTGPTDVLENERGFFAAYGEGSSAIGRLDTSQVPPYVVGSTYYKPYATCSATHPIIDCVQDILSRGPVESANITRIVVGTSQRGATQNNNPHPGDTMAIQYSLQSATALALLGVIEDHDSFDPVRYGELGAPEVAAMVDIEVDPDVEAVYPDRIGGRVTIEFADGEKAEAFRDGLATYGSDDDRRHVVEDKFRHLTRQLLTDEVQHHVLSLVESLKAGGAVKDLADALRLYP